jgi:HEPN domain-containing protein
MSDLEHARLMLHSARKDLRALAGMGDKERFADEIFGFHAQQAVEKSLKAWSSSAGIEYPKIHDLEELFALLDDKGQTVPERLKPLVDLTYFAVQFRYEAFEDAGSELERPEVLGQVRELVEYVEGLIGSSSAEQPPGR